MPHERLTTGRTKVAPLSKWLLSLCPGKQWGRVLILVREQRRERERDEDDFSENACSFVLLVSYDQLLGRKKREKE